MRYGLPYKGSKNAIAKWVVENLPRSEVLVDLFCGGCAVTHAALESGKFQRIIANDIRADVPKLFKDWKGCKDCKVCKGWKGCKVWKGWKSKALITGK